MNETEQPDKPAKYSMISGPLSGWIVLWSFIVFIAAAAGQMSLIVWLPRLFPIFDDMAYLQAVIILAYWLLLAVLFAWETGKQIYDRVEWPMRKLGEATSRVAKGDFSVYVAPQHIEGSRDWNSTDQMFSDFNTMVEELGGIETMKNVFVSNVSHEIRNPLAVIKNYATMMRDIDMDKDQREECVRIITAASERLNALVTNILKLNKLESQTIVSQAVDYDLTRQLTEEILTLDDLFTEKNIDLDCDLEDRAMVHADPGITTLIWSNVLGNALKYTERGGHVSVIQRSQGSMVSVEISDDGCGMTPDEAAHMFDKFYQGDTSHASQGNGLGMAMVRRAVDLSRGFIDVASAKGKGTTITVRLPAARL
ncbi:MAG: HAMP domain-containing sensor histidine kinase [Bifidobacterium scardovii]|uniref:HAMP domain-containing sensor histidine kinase n=1 Tax=Bifidobacterium scardovii TaxID=158787 RepID=UPI002900451B|nr:HAMP domain-containing sensor histidine kinase [Bifidobacterium scardovii]MDU2422501.1 HAMP domain-containing sensor histidine kinase [Bifidobacterium scardovii]